MLLLHELTVDFFKISVKLVLLLHVLIVDFFKISVTSTCITVDLFKTTSIDR